MRGVFRLSGPSAERYLQGRCTQDVKAVGESQSKDALILSPQGKIEGKFSINRSADGFFILTDPLNSNNPVEDFTASFLKFKVADQFEFTDVSSEFSVLSLHNYSETEIESFKNQFVKEIGSEIPVSYFKRENHFGSECLVLIGIDPTKPVAESNLEKINEIFKPVSANEFLRFRIENLIPLMGVDVDKTVLAPEMDLESFISLGKGCYAGQEVVEMATARGRPNRKFVQYKSTSECPKGVEIFDVVSADGSKIGNVTSSINSAEGFLGMGFLKTKAIDSNEFYLAASGENFKIELIK